MVTHLLIDDFEVGATVEDTWRLMCQPANLRRLTPRWMRFRPRTHAPVEVALGTRIDYWMTWHGIPMPWRSLITEYEEGRRLAYIQLTGPYAMWLHQHAFQPCDGGTRVMDRCYYRMPLGPVGWAVHELTVRGQVLDIFRHRRRALARLLGPVRGLDGPRITPA